ncbi:IS5/IS1182 family transposase, partial [Xanthomonas campestris pv. campestris]|nr:IS5/IS1182 family transposase [Xanthomonas campestris pv. campestris]
RGLAKNMVQVLTLFALSTLCMARRQLLPARGEYCLAAAKAARTLQQSHRTQHFARQ